MVWAGGGEWPHPYHGSGAQRRANPCCRRSRSTVDAAVMGSVAATAARSSRPALASPARRTRPRRQHAMASIPPPHPPPQCSVFSMTMAVLSDIHVNLAFWRTRDSLARAAGPRQPSCELRPRPVLAVTAHARPDPAVREALWIQRRPEGVGFMSQAIRGCRIDAASDPTPLAVVAELRGAGRSRWDRRTGAI